MSQMQEFFNNIFYFGQDNITRIGQMAADLRPESDGAIYDLASKYHAEMDKLIGEEMTIAELEGRINNIIREFGEELDALLGT